MTTSGKKPTLFTFSDEILFSVDRVCNDNWPHDEKRIVEFGIGLQERPISYYGESHNAESEWYEVRFHCKEHPNTQMVHDEPHYNLKLNSVKLECPLCRNAGKSPCFTAFRTYEQMAQTAIDLFNSHLYNDYKLVRIDDVYVPEAKISFKQDIVTAKTTDCLPDGCKVVFDIKKDKNNQEILMLQIFKSGSPKGAQFFIKPEQGQVVSDHNNPTPGEFIAEIAVRFSDRTIVQTFDGSNNPADKGL